MAIEDVWPLFALRLTTPRLVLRVVRDEDLEGLVDAALAGIHDADRMPFQVPWTDQEPDVLRRELARFQWSLRVRSRPEDWSLPLAILQDGVPIGVQDVSGRDFAARRTVESGSWLTRSAQGRGLGTEMRAAALLLAFDHLGAEWAESSAAAWNERSLGVSRRLGYRPNGVARVHPRGDEVVDELRLRLHRDELVRPEWTLRVEGLDLARPQLLGTTVAP